VEAKPGGHEPLYNPSGPAWSGNDKPWWYEPFWGLSRPVLVDPITHK